MKKILILVPLLFCLTGCYNYRELNDLAIVSGISINKNEEEYIVTAEVVNPKKEQDASSGREPDFVIYTGKGKSMQEAFRKIVKEAPKKLYGAQMDVFIIDEETAKTELKNILDFFSRDPEIRSEFNVLVGKSTNVLDITTPLDNISSKSILDSLESNNNYLGLSNLVTYHDLIDNYLNPNIELALPTVEVIDSETEKEGAENESKGESIKNIETTSSEIATLIGNIAVFKDNKLVGYLSEEESQAYNMVMNNAKITLMKTDYENEQFIVNEILNSSSDIEINIKKKKVTISIKGKATISEANYSGNLDDPKEILKVQKDLNKTTENFIEKALKNTIKKYNSDIYGFRDMFYKQDPKAYKKIKDTWYEDVFPNLDIEVKANITLFEKGNLNGGVYHE